MYPKEQHDPTQQELHDAEVRDPEGATDRGKWRDVSFLRQVGSPEFNKQLDKTQFADFHEEKGMQCADCHFEQDSHGNGKLYGESRNVIVVTCESCHGDVTSRATLVMNGPAAPDHGINMGARTTPFGERQFYWKGDRLYQRSIMNKDLEWEVVQVLDTITPGRPHY